MYNLINSEGLTNRLVNKQFEMIGVDVTIDQLERDGGVKIMKGKKEVIEDYRKHYLFENEEQYLEWKRWVAAELMKFPDCTERSLQEDLNYVDLRYGLNYKV